LLPRSISFRGFLFVRCTNGARSSEQSGRGVKLRVHLNLVTKLRMRGATPTLLYEFMMCTFTDHSVTLCICQQLRNLCCQRNIYRANKSKRTKWARHVARTGDGNYKCVENLVWKGEGERPMERLTNKHEDSKSLK